ESDWAVWKGDRLTNGGYLHAATLAEAIQRTGRSTVVAGTKAVALLLDRASRQGQGNAERVTLFEGVTIPGAAMDRIRPTFGPFPLKANPKKSANVEEDLWTTQVLVGKLWKDHVPTLTMLWLSEPDYAQHGSGPGSKVARMAIKSSDDNLERVLSALDNAHVREKTDVLVVSDHGFSTISQAIDLVELLTSAGFRAFKEFNTKRADGDMLVVGHGGSASIYVTGHDGATIASVVEFLQKSDFAGVIFSRHAMEGTFSLEQVGIDSPDGPDV